MAFAIVLQGIATDCSEMPAPCPECGNTVSLRRYASLPFKDVPAIELEIIEVICETCDIHIIMCDVNRNEAKSTPSPKNSVQSRKSNKNITH